MNIILYKDTLYNTQELHNEVTSNDTLNGFVLTASMTKDEKIIVYNFASNTNAYTNNIQNENLNVLKENSFVEIQDFLKYFTSYKGKIIINLIGYPDLITKPNKNEIFVRKMKKILDMYPHLNIYICSAYDDVITFINKYLDNNIKKGMLVYKGNLNYYDVDFYIIPYDMFDTKIVFQQLNLKKEIMIFLQFTEDIITLTDNLNSKKDLLSSISDVEANKLFHIVTNSPRVMDIVLNKTKISHHFK